MAYEGTHTDVSLFVYHGGGCMRFGVKKGLNFNRRRRRIDRNATKNVLFWIIEIMIAVAIAFVCVYCFGMRATVAGDSMSPTLKNNNRVLVNRLVYHLSGPKSGDVIVFYPNGNKKSRCYVKRVVGEPGDKVQIKDGAVYVNGELFDQTDTEAIETAGLAEEVITVGEDEYFVLGDNRDNSEDSRYANIGNVKKDDIVGKAWFCTYPWSSIGRIK